MKEYFARLAVGRCFGAMVLIAALVNMPATIWAQQVEMTDQQIDQWLYGGNSNGLGSDDLIAVAIGSVDSICHLTQPQQDKLRLAAEGDFTRFSARADDLRAQYVGKTIDQNELN